MMPKVSINIDVDDLEKGVAFYAAAVGLTPVRRLGDFAVELAGAQAPVFLLRKAPATPAFAGAAIVRDYARHWTPVHLDFLVEELEGALDRAVSAGARAESAIESLPVGPDGPPGRSVRERLLSHRARRRGIWRDRDALPST